MRIAVDVMGGDHAPDAILKGCAIGLEHLAPEDRLLLVGREGDITDVLSELGVSDSRIEIRHCEQVIEMGESPAMAVRSKTDSSIVQMALLGSQKTDEAERADVVISAGNTGACVSAGIMQMKRLRGVHRPGIAVAMPSYHGPMVLCDAGANPEPKGSHLYQYALMSDVYARSVLGVENPRVAILNIGSEEAKGTGIIKEARDLIKSSPELNYIGYIEGRQFFEGAADVIVTDGFIGNAMLKMAEGLAKSLFTAIGKEIAEIDPELMLSFEPVMKGIYAKHDYHEHGGAPLLGVNGLMIIAHGSSQPRTIANAIKAGRNLVAAGVNEQISKRIESHEMALAEGRA